TPSATDSAVRSQPFPWERHFGRCSPHVEGDQQGEEGDAAPDQTGEKFLWLGRIFENASSFHAARQGSLALFRASARQQRRVKGQLCSREKRRKVFTVLQRFSGTDRERGNRGTGGDGLGFEQPLFGDLRRSSEINGDPRQLAEGERSPRRQKRPQARRRTGERASGLGSLCIGQTSGWGLCRGSRDITTTTPSAPGRTPSTRWRRSW
ncbi:unnamed protein product, partial [Ectocarpus sp. 8 AP-2014]